MSAAARIAAAEPDALDPAATFPPDERIAAALDQVVQLFGAPQVPNRRQMSCSPTRRIGQPH